LPAKIPDAAQESLVEGKSRELDRSRIELDRLIGSGCRVRLRRRNDTSAALAGGPVTAATLLR
jgi:hypothetical protein